MFDELSPDGSALPILIALVAGLVVFLLYDNTVLARYVISACRDEKAGPGLRKNVGDLTSSKEIVSYLLRTILQIRGRILKGKGDAWVHQFHGSTQLFVRGILHHPDFKRLKSMKIDEVVRDEKAATAEECRALLPKLGLAQLAYESDTEILKAQLATHGYDLYHKHKIVKTGDIGYYIGVDHSKKILLFGTKGSNTLADAMTNCIGVTMQHSCSPCCPFSGAKHEREIRCHKGMYHAAMSLVEREMSVIEELAVKEHYKIHIVGHSLGAGAAALFGILLRSNMHEKFRSPGFVRVWAFASPAVVDLQTSIESHPFITSVVNKTDVVPRLSLSNAEIFATSMAELSKALHADDGKAFAGIRGGLAARKKIREGELPLPFENLFSIVQSAQKKCLADTPDNLYAPGNIFFLYDKIGYPSDKASGKEPKIQTKAVKVDGSFLLLRFFAFDKHMISDHMCDSYAESLRDCSS